jgi:hypothetical protein
MILVLGSGWRWKTVLPGGWWRLEFFKNPA